jgi:hypothetical protein
MPPKGGMSSFAGPFVQENFLNGNNDFNTGRPKALIIGGENMTKMKLRELERVEITILVDKS